MTENKQDTSYTPSSDIAIIGMSCRFPGAKNIDEFWQNLIDGKETIRRFTEKELLDNGEKLSLIKQQNYVNARGVVADADLFDAPFFGYSATDAKLLDPQHRIFMECGWEALENAGYTPEKCKDLIGVYASMAESSYLQENILKNTLAMQSTDWLQLQIANSLTTLSTQVSYRLNLKGPSVNITTACSSSLVTVIYACKALLDYDCDIAIAGAAVISIPQLKGYLYQQGGIESQDGHCRAFDADATGTVFSDGVGVVVLKRLSEAVRDNDFIYATIKGWNVNNDGSDKIGYTAPTVQGQARCILSAANFADINLASLSYIETHGTGTAMGDPIEINAMRMAFEAQTDKHQFCGIGSVKTNIGHADIAAGMASIIKTALMLKNQTMPATLHYKKNNPAIDFTRTPFYVNAQLTAWNHSDTSHPRRAGINSSGIGGTNAFLILEEASTAQIEKYAFETTDSHLLLLSAKTQQALNDMHNRLQMYLHQFKTIDNQTLRDIAYTLQVGRKDFEFRQVLICNSQQRSLENTLNLSPEAAGLSHLKCEQTLVSYVNNTKKIKIAFMFPGQGSQYPGMSKDLYHLDPEFSKLIDQGISQLNELIQFEVRSLLLGGNSVEENLNNTSIVQPALFIFEHALSTFLMQLGVIPDALLGHSLGEYVAACLAGVMDYHTALNLIQLRAQLMEMTEPGLMLALACDEITAVNLIQSHAVCVAACNTATNTVISGSPTAIAYIERSCLQAKIASKRLPSVHAFHSKLMEPILGNFMRALEKIALHHPAIPFISNVSGEWAQDYEVITPEYWVNQITNPVRFADGVQCLVNQNFNVFLELGPSNTLTQFVKKITQNDKKLLITNLNQHGSIKGDTPSQYLKTIAELWLQGVKIDWHYFNHHQRGARIPLPTYPFQRQRFWISPSQTEQAQLSLEKLPYSQWFYEPSWQRASANPNLPEDFFTSPALWILFSDPSILCMQLHEYLQKNNHTVVTIHPDSHFISESPYLYKMDIANKEHYQLVVETVLSKHTQTSPLYIINLLPDTETNDLDESLNRCFYSSLFLTQSMNEQNFTAPVHILLAGKDIFSIMGETVEPVKSTLIGPCRILPLEHQQIKTKIVDFQHEFQDIAPSLVAEILDIDTSADMIAYRKHYRWIQTFMPLNIASKARVFLPDNGLFVLTGGFGGIALTLVKYITEMTKQPKFVLLSRSEFPEQNAWDDWLQTHEQSDVISKKILKLRNCVEQGAEINWFSLNIADSQRLNETIKIIKHQWGSINGVIHCAGNPGGGLAQFKTKAMAEKVFEPKIKGTYALCHAFKHEPLDFFILCSSICSVVGEFSQIDYCSANACLDAIPYTHLLPLSKSVISINWNSWQEVGMSVETDRPRDISFFDRNNDISPQQGAQIFYEALQQNVAQLIVSTTSLENFKTYMQTQSTQEIRATERLNRDVILQNADTYLAPRTDAEKQIALIWQEFFSLDKIGVQDDFYDLGGHSLTALHLLNQINQKFKSAINVANFLSQATTIEQLAKLIDKSNPKSISTASVLIPLRIQGKQPPLFCLHPVSGTAVCYVELAKYLRYNGPIYGIQDPSLEHKKSLFSSLEDMASAYIVEIKNIQPMGPYILGGLSFGATLAVEVARQLRLAGDTIAALFFFDGWAKFSTAQHIEERFQMGIKQLYKKNPNTQNFYHLAWERMQLLLNYTIQPIKEPVFLYKAQTLLPEYIEIDDPHNYWKKHVNNTIEVHIVPGDHETILSQPNIQILAKLVDKMLLKMNHHIKTFALSES